ncbi:alpha-L-fucosidase [Streptococcus koreensis]|uniref:alpha-L-fucosidase n=1 Tax=Streptococcus koreensis TaxID=2382163 RepID=A0ABM6Z907_9STRE|nr:YSIRK-type signal peptide-containing protein [Streptococcus koreensis]
MGKRLFDKRNRFGIRKLSVGVCSVVVATCFLGVTTSYAEEQAERSETREERVNTSDVEHQGEEEKAVKEHQEESEHSSPVTSEKENRAVSQGTEAAQPATSLDEEPEIADYGPLPSKAQMQYHREELAAFIHFGMNTYYDREWGDGQEDPYYFYPEHLDTDQWIKTLKDAGFKRTIMVVKHHDGFLLYPSKYTDHTIAKSGWKEGKGDILAEVSASASKYDMDMGVYLSPWDAHSPLYHVDTEDQYNEYYLNQLKEILENPKYGNKGKFVEVWMDGARGDGAQKVTYTFDKWFDAIRKAQGDIAIFSAEPTNVRWIGNEKGIAGDPVWHKVNPDKIRNNPSNSYLNHGDPEGKQYSVGEADVSIRSGWFYHDNQEPKSLRELMDIYFKSVGRGTPLLLNIPPNQDGKFADADVARLKEFRQTLDQLYSVDYAAGALVEADSTRRNSHYAASHLTDGDEKTSWAPADDAKTGSFVLDLGKEQHFDVVELKETIEKGQRISGFTIDVAVNGQWVPFGAGSTVGYRRLIKGQPVDSRYLRVSITDAQATPILNGVSVYKTPASIEETDGYPLGLTYHSDRTADRGNSQWNEEGEGVRGTSMWTKEAGASATYQFEGTKAYVVATVDPGHGEMDVYVDGQKLATVNTQSPTRKRSQKVYETPDLKAGSHTLTLVNSKGDAIATEGIYALNNQEKGLFEFAQPTLAVKKGEPAQIVVKRKGGSKGSASLKLITEPGTGVHGKVYKDTNVTLEFADGETEKTVQVPTLDFAGKATDVYDFKAKLLHPDQGSLVGFIPELTVQVMNEDLLPENRKEVDDQDPKLHYSQGWNHETDNRDFSNGTESWSSFNQVTDEEGKKHIDVTITFKGTGVEVRGVVDPSHGLYSVTLDGKEMAFEEGRGHDYEIEGDHYFSGYGDQRKLDQSLVNLQGLAKGYHQLRLHLDPSLNDPQSSRAIQVDRFILSGKDSQLLSQEELQQIIKEGVEKIKATSLDRLKANLKSTVQEQLTELTQLLNQERPDLVATANQVEALETILEDAHNYEPLTQTRPDEGVRDLILEKPELLIEAEEIPFESQTRENKDLTKGESRILQAGKVGRRLKLIEVRQEEGKEIRTEVDAFVEVEAQDQITEVGTGVVEEHSVTPDLPTPITPVTPSKDLQVHAHHSTVDDKKEKETPVLLKETTPEVTSVLTAEHPVVEEVESPSLQPEGKLPQTGSEKASFLAWMGLFGLGFLGGRVKFARRKS